MKEKDILKGLKNVKNQVKMSEKQKAFGQAKLMAFTKASPSSLTFTQASLLAAAAGLIGLLVGSKLISTPEIAEPEPSLAPEVMSTEDSEEVFVSGTTSVDSDADVVDIDSNADTDTKSKKVKNAPYIKLLPEQAKPPHNTPAREKHKTGP